MLSSAEILTVAISGVMFTGASVVGTVYFAAGDGDLPAYETSSGAVRYELGDAFFTCRDQIAKAIPYRVRNVSVDSRSSRYDEERNNNIVFIDAEVVERPGSFHSKSNYQAKITCSVAAASNEVVGFNVRKM